MKNMDDCYHMTSEKHLRSIATDGLIPSCGANSSLIGDTAERVYFSEGFEGAIALYVDFFMVFNQLKANPQSIIDHAIRQRIENAANLEDYLGDCVYLYFKKKSTINERNFENGCTAEIISPERLSLVVLDNKLDNTSTYSHRGVILYMMAHTEPDSIRYHGANYPGAPDIDAATERIRQKVLHYYLLHNREIEKYRLPSYSLHLIPLNKIK